MTDVEQFLAEGHAQRQWDGDFIAAANPIAVLRLVGMVRRLSTEDRHD